MIRQVLVSFVGHVDHGKSSILDRIRGTTIVEREAGAITQAIGASIIPIETVRRVCGPLLDLLKTDITIPGFLAIDTPGHAAFTNLRKRGGSLADIAVVVIDLNEGFKPQTIEAIEILRAHKTPFVIAANKIDLCARWRGIDGPLLACLQKQDPQTITDFEEKMYKIVGELYERFEMESERFDRVSDYTKQIAIVPTSATTGAGIPELLMVLTGLAQRFFEKNLNFDPDAPAKGVVLEVKEERGIGKALDTIIFDGTIKVGDQIVIAGVNRPVITKVKALFAPAPLAEMRDKKTKFTSVKSATAATGIKISAKEIDEVVAGMPLQAASDETLEEVTAAVQDQVDELLLETDGQGVVIRADSLGSLEALVTLLHEADIEIKNAGIGPIGKKAVIAAEGNLEEDPLHAAVLGFNVEVAPGVDTGQVKVFSHQVVYKLIEDLLAWQEGQHKEMEKEKLDGLIRPGKFEILPGYVFRQSNPAVVGVDVLAGQLTSGAGVMTPAGDNVGTIKNIQQEKETLKIAEKGKQVAVSITGAVVGRSINERDTLFIDVPEDHFRRFKELKHLLSGEERGLLKQIAEIKREKNPVWGV